MDISTKNRNTATQNNTSRRYCKNSSIMKTHPSRRVHWTTFSVQQKQFHYLFINNLVQ